MQKKKSIVLANSNPVTVQEFAEGIEKCAQIAQGAKIKYTPSAMQLRICRLIFGRNKQIAAQMSSKWVEWRYGKNPEETVANMTVVLGDVVNISQGGDLDAARQIWLGRGAETEHQGDAGGGTSTQSVPRSRLLNAAPSEGEREVES